MMKSKTSHFTTKLALFAVSALLAACNGNGGPDGSTGRPDAVSPPASRTLTGVVSKGPISGATISLYSADADGFIANEVPVAQTVTDAAGNWAVVVDSFGALLVVSQGGSYVDESDAQPDPQNRRTVEIADDAGFEAYLPAGANVTPLNVYTMSLLRRSRLQNPGDAFDAAFAINRTALSSALGFDPVTVMPSDPIVPAATDSLPSRQYAMALGGAANAINSLAIALGADAPDFAVIQAIVDDLTDCTLDAQAVSGAVMVQTSSGEVAAVAGQDLNAQILRFRNNNFSAYQNTSLLVVNSAACDTVVVVPDSQAPVFSIVPAAFIVNAASANGTPLSEPAIAGVLASATATDNRPGPVTRTNDAPVILPLGQTTVTFTATDAAGNSSQASVVVTVADLQAPVIDAPDAISVTATGALTGVQLGAAQVSDNVSAQTALQIVNDAPANGFGPGDTTVTWTVTDEAGLSSSDTQTVSVLPAPPALSNPIPDASATEGVAFVLDISGAFTDPDSDLVFSVAGLPVGTGIGIDPATGLLAGTPQPADVVASPLQVAITASDGAASVTDTFTLTVIGVNSPPAFTLSADLVLTEDFAGSETVTVTPGPVPIDEIAQTVTYSLSPAPDEVTLAAVQFDAQTGAVSFTSLPDANGMVVFTLTADDGQAENSTFSASFSVAVDAVNDPPSFTTSGDVVQFEDFAGTVSVTVTPDPVAPDESGQTVVYSLAGPAVNFATVNINPQTGEVSITSLPDAVGIASITIVADDGQLENAVFQQSFVLTIESANDVPQLVSSIGTQSAVVGTLFSLTVADNFSDPDGDALVFDVADAPANFSFNAQSGEISGTPQQLDSLIRRFDIRVTAIDTSGARTHTVFDLFVGMPDRDNDGLPDAEELLIGTNPDNPDTDNDGVGDRIENDTSGDPLTPAGSVFYVSPDGDDAASGLSWAQAKASNAGLGVIPPGASPNAPTYVLYAGNLEGLLASGEWRLNLTPPCDNIYLVGSQEADDFATKLTPAGAPATRFAIAGGSGLSIGACNNVVVKNIEFTGATNGAVVATGASVILQGVVIRDSLSLDAGAGLRVSGGSVDMRGSTVASNGAATDGAGVYATGGAVLTIAGSRFEGNAALGNGGAVYLQNADASSSIINSQFTGNRAANGGALALAGVSGTLLANNTLRLNQADATAAAIWFDGNGSGPVVRDSVLTGNHAGGAPSVYNAAITAAMSSYNLLDLPVGGIGSINALSNDAQVTAAGFLDQALSPAVDAGSTTAAVAGLDTHFTDPDRFAPVPDSGILDLGAHATRPYNGGADDYDEPLAVQNVINLRPGLGPQPVIITPSRNGQPIGSGHQLVATTGNAAIAELLSVTTTDPLGNANSVLLIDLGNGDYRFAADAGAQAGETVLSIFVDGALVERDPPVVLRQCSPPVICEF